jgi:hypothetical protein
MLPRDRNAGLVLYQPFLGVIYVVFAKKCDNTFIV